MTVSTFPSIANRDLAATSARKTSLRWVDVYLPKAIPAPEGFEDIDSIVARHEANTTRGVLLIAARKALAKRAANKVPGIAQLRLRKGWSQMRLSKEIGTSQSYIARLEVSHEDVLMSTARRLAAALGVSIEEIDTALRARKEPR
jgi:DNA-binding XRE family transcriptional regulator